MKNLFKTKTFWAIIIVLILLGLSFFLPEKKTQYETIRADYDSIKETVSVTGTVESDAIINLAFQKNGTVQTISSAVGDTVSPGTVLMELQQDLANIDVKKAQAGLQLAQSELNLIKAGTTKEEKNIAQAQVDEAQVNLDNATKTLQDTRLANAETLKRAELNLENAQILLTNSQSNLSTTELSTENQTQQATESLENAYTNATIQLKSAVDEINNSYIAADKILGIDDQSANNDFDSLLGAASFKNLNQAKNQYRSLSPTLEKYNSSYQDLKATDYPQAETEQFLVTTSQTLIELKSLLDKVYQSLEDTPASPRFNQSQIDLKKSEIQSKRTALINQQQLIQTNLQSITNAQLSISGTDINNTSNNTSAQTNLSTAENSLKVAQRNLEEAKIQNQISENNAQMQLDLAQARLDQAKANLDRTKASPRSVDIASSQARIAQAKATLQESQIIADYGKLKSPTRGVITKILMEPGESVAVGQEVLRMITKQLSIVANVSETDITKINLNDPISITFDAFTPQDIFEGQVVSIDPAETVIDGVINYQIKMVFDNPDKKDVKSGMTANIDIFTDEKEEVLTIPSEAVQFEADQTIVRILENDQAVQRQIQIGIEGQNKIEVTDGLRGGEKVILYELD